MNANIKLLLIKIKKFASICSFAFAFLFSLLNTTCNNCIWTSDQVEPHTQSSSPGVSQTITQIFLQKQECGYQFKLIVLELLNGKQCVIKHFMHHPTLIVIFVGQCAICFGSVQMCTISGIWCCMFCTRSLGFVFPKILFC